jgi:hypothetical protein
MDWELRMRWVVAVIFLLPIHWATVLAAQSDSQIDIKTLASSMEKRFQACPRREVVAQFDRKHHKQTWQKQAWGPPTEVLTDAKANDENSILYPYIVTVEFTLKRSFGLERQSRADAEEDSDLSSDGMPDILLVGRYRNTYLVGKDTRLKKTEFLTNNFGGAPGEWRERPRWPEACWDRIDIVIEDAGK